MSAIVFGSFPLIAGESENITDPGNALTVFTSAAYDPPAQARRANSSKGGMEGGGGAD
ncbi:MAG: hypothetical protein JETCAE02_15870 [Anaerolineaceae bacterium]|nr:hypothetical protein DIM_27550 [Candidatus Denitrolinea symbiosum]GIK08695.1 MAG: hypothetical protein BroJett001_07610 [Chloroflexota bacterium]GJQ39175.1 MAG: hypothetical protein JETCAE02_15870 [Anaerolineaceae bacterium]